MRQRLFFYGAEGLLHQLFILGPLHVTITHVTHGAGEETAGATRRVEDDISGLRVDPIHHEGGHGAGRVVLAGIASRLQVVEQVLVDVAKMLPLGEVVEVDLVDLVHHLPQQMAGFHIVVGVLEHVFDHTATIPASTCGLELLEGRTQLIVDESQQRIACHTFRVSCPIPPLKPVWDR